MSIFKSFFTILLRPRYRLRDSQYISFAQNEGVIVQEPSVVAIDSQKNHVLSVGNEAKRMIGRTPGNVIAVRPYVMALLPILI